MDTQKILLVDASPEFCGVISDMLGGSVELVLCHDGIKALELLERFRPDVLVTDLTLPGLDGISLLKAATGLTPRPACLVTTRFLSPYIENTIESLRVDMVVMKPCDVRSLADLILDLSQQKEMGALSASYDDPIINALIALNVPTNRSGFQVLADAIGIYMDCPGISMTKELYPILGKRHERSVCATERVIRTALQDAWETRDEKIWRIYFHPDHTGHIARPSNSSFISAIAEHLRMGCLQQSR